MGKEGRQIVEYSRATGTSSANLPEASRRAEILIGSDRSEPEWNTF